MLNKLKKTNNKGFTIIEVMIVLAIAGLILLIVFLAVPALQRSQKNTSRKADAGHIETAINDFSSNNNNALPGNTGGTGASWASVVGPPAVVGDCATVISDAGTLAEYNAANGFTCGGYAASPATAAANKFDDTSGAFTASGLAAQSMEFDSGATCPATTGTTTLAASAASAEPDSAALFYTTQTTTGNWDWECINI